MLEGTFNIKSRINLLKELIDLVKWSWLYILGAAYFCPNYCSADHVHYAHNIEFICDNDTICSHYIYRNFKKDTIWQSKIKE